VDLLEELDAVTDAVVLVPRDLEPVDAPDSAAGATRASESNAPPAVPDFDLPLAANRDFKVVAVGQGISAVGDAVSLTALPLLVLALTGSGLQMGVVGVMTRLPDLIFGLPAGAYADRWDRRKMMLAADAGRCILTALIPLSFILGVPTMGVVLLVAFPINFCRVFFMAGWTAAVPNLVGRRQIGRATSIFEAFNSGSFIVGPGIAGLLVGIVGAAPTLAIDAASFAVSAASLSIVRRSLRSNRPRLETHIAHEIVEGIRFIRGQAALRAAIGLWTAIGICTAPLIASLTFFVTIDRGLGPSALGFVISAYSVGSLVGALVGGRRARGHIGILIFASNLVTGLVIVLLSFAHDLAPMLLLAFAGGMAGSVWAVLYLTLRASVSPDHLLGRVGSTARTMSIGLQPIGMLTGGLLLDRIGGAGTLEVIGVSLIAVTAVFALSRPLRGASLEARSRIAAG
jgi:MFS family permease